MQWTHQFFQQMVLHLEIQITEKLLNLILAEIIFPKVMNKFTVEQTTKTKMKIHNMSQQEDLQMLQEDK